MEGDSLPTPRRPAPARTNAPAGLYPAKRSISPAYNSRSHKPEYHIAASARASALIGSRIKWNRYSRRLSARNNISRAATAPRPLQQRTQTPLLPKRTATASAHKRLSPRFHPHIPHSESKRTLRTPNRPASFPRRAGKLTASRREGGLFKWP